MRPTIVLILLVFFFAIIGAALNIITKCFFVEESEQFSLTWFFNIIMFLGEAIGLPIYYIKSCISSRKKLKEDLEGDILHGGMIEKIDEEEKPKKAKVFLLIIPSLFDTFATFLGNISLSYLQGSLLLTLRGGLIIIITFIISKFFIKNKHILDHYISIPIAFIGFIFVGVSAFIDGSSKEGERIISEYTTLLFIGLIIIAIFLMSSQYCLEEHFMRKYNFAPLYCIGYQGLFGFFFNLIVCIILSFINCGDNPSNFFQNICVKDDNDVWKVENFLFSLTQIFKKTKFTVYVIIMIFGFSLFNFLVINIIKFGGAMGMSLVEHFRSFFVYIFFLLPIAPDDLQENFNWFRLIGLILIFISIIIYFGIFKCDQRKIIRQKKRYLDKMDKMEKGDEFRIRNDDDY